MPETQDHKLTSAAKAVSGVIGRRDALAEANRRIDALESANEALSEALAATRDEVRRLSEELTESLNRLAAELGGTQG